MKNFFKKILVIFFYCLINFLSVFFKKKSDLILCFDCLYDVNQEQIDALTLFKYLKKQKINSKYIALKGAKLNLKDNFDDVIFVKNKWEFVFRNLFLILSSRYVFTSFGLFDGLDFVLKKSRNFEYIFLEHGVTYIFNSTLKIYTSKNFNRILTPTKYTYHMYKKNNLWNDEKMILSGLPRWDELNDKKDTSNKIFIFFSWRKAFLNNPCLAEKYIEKISSFLTSLVDILPENIEINFAYHHEILKNKIKLSDLSSRINLIKTNRISSIIKETDLLITDFSSVCWDYFYRNKPVIFYRFDSSEAYLNDLDVENMKALSEVDNIFFNCFCDEDDVKEKILFYVGNNYKLENCYIDFLKELFWEDRDNCKKICEILKIK